MPTHPIHSLPPELLGRVFVSCLPTKDPDRLDPTQAPMVLCCVCSYWRSIAFKEHALWDKVVLPVSPDWCARAERFIADGHIDGWFERAGPERTLTLGEDTSQDATDATHHRISLLEEYQHAITQYSSRLQHLSVRLAEASDVLMFCKLPAGDYPELTSFSVHAARIPQSQLPPRILTPFFDAPKLKHLSFSTYRLGHGSFDLPWSRIKKLEHLDNHSNLGIVRWRQMLSYCVALEDGLFHYPFSQEDLTVHADPSEYTTHKALKSLTIVTPRDGMAEWACLRGPVLFPSLQRLELRFESGRYASSSLLEHDLNDALPNLEILVFRGPEPSIALPEAEAFVEEWTHKPGAFRRLVHLTLPFGSSTLEDLSELLLVRPETAKRPALQVHIDTSGCEFWEWRSLNEAKSKMIREVAERIHLD